MPAATYPTAKQARDFDQFGDGLSLPTEQQVRDLMARAEQAGDVFTEASCRSTLKGSSTHLLAVAMCLPSQPTT